MGESTTTNFTHNSLRNGVTYRYTVRAMDKNNKFVSDYNKEGYSNTFFAPSVISSLQNVFGGVTVKWSKNSAIDSYRIYRKTKNTGWKRIGNSDNGSFTDTTAESGISYTYTLSALDAENNFVSYCNGGKSITYVKAPTIYKIENTATGSKISWGKCSGASKYRVYYLKNRSWKALGNTTATSFTHYKLKSETKYTYTVRCLDSKGNFASGYDKNGTSNTFIAPPAISKVSKAGKGNLVKWKSVPKAAGYRLYRKTVNTSWSRLADVTEGTSYTDTSAKKGNVYSYTLRCLDKNGVCCESEEMRLAAEYMMTYCKGNTLDERMKTGFLYMAKNFPYHRTYDHPKKAADLPALAIDLFKNKKGNCFRYAAAFACTARIAGYRSRVVIGDVLGSPHGWVEVLVNGEWLICDPDAQLPGYKAPDYKPYMMKKHYWTLNPHVKCEVTIESGKAVWK